MKRAASCILLLFTLLALVKASSQMIPFAFYKQGAILNWDFTALTSIPAELTFTRSTTGTYFNAAGVMQTAAISAPRFDYDMATHAANGLLMEPAATNLIPCSSDINIGTCWSNDSSPTTMSLNSVVAPDGTTTADRMTTTGDAFVYPTTPATTLGATYTFSCYLKSTIPGGADILLQENGGSYTWWGQTSMLLTTSWQRYTVSAARTTANPMRATINLFHASYGDTTSIDIWGCQYELGAVATSYIPTTTVSVTRGADAAVFNSMSWFNATNGSLFAEYTNLGAESATTYRVFGVSNTNVAGTFANNAIEIADTGTTGAIDVTTASTAVFTPAGTLNAAGTVNRQAFTYKANNFTSSINRGAITTDTSGTLPAPAYGYIGSAPDGNSRSRYIRKIRYFKDPVTPQVLIGL